MIDPLAIEQPHSHRARHMLTGDQIRAARHLAGIQTQADLAKLAGLGRATVERAEQSGTSLPSMGVDAMAKIVGVLERAGVVFDIPAGASLAGGLGMHLVATNTERMPAKPGRKQGGV